MVKYNFDQLANRKNDCSKKWTRSFCEERFGPLPENFISMWIADMDFELAPMIHERLQEILDAKTLAYIYPYDGFFEAIQYWMRSKTKNEVPKEHIRLDYGIVNSLYHMIMAFTKPGDRVLMNTPVYNPFREASERNYTEIIENELVLNEEHRYEIDFEALEQQMIEHQPKVYILCSPHNPGGTVWSKDTLEKIAELALEHDVMLVADEAHSDHIHEGEFFSTLDLEEKYRQNLIYINSPNKAFNIAGLKTSYAVIPSETLRERYCEMLSRCHISDPNVFGAAALTAAYTPEGKEWMDQSYAYIIKNYDWVSSYIEKHLPEIKIMPMDASYVMWLDVSGTGMDGDSFTKGLAQEAGVLVQEGSSFGEAGKQYVRLNIGTSFENVKNASMRMNDWLEAQR